MFFRILSQYMLSVYIYVQKWLYMWLRRIHIDILYIYVLPYGFSYQADSKMTRRCAWVRKVSWRRSPLPIVAIFSSPRIHRRFCGPFFHLLSNFSRGRSSPRKISVIIAVIRVHCGQKFYSCCGKREKSFLCFCVEYWTKVFIVVDTLPRNFGPLFLGMLKKVKFNTNFIDFYSFPSRFFRTNAFLTTSTVIKKKVQHRDGE